MLTISVLDETKNDILDTTCVRLSRCVVEFYFSVGVSSLCRMRDCRRRFDSNGAALTTVFLIFFERSVLRLGNVIS